MLVHQPQFDGVVDTGCCEQLAVRAKGHGGDWGSVALQGERQFPRLDRPHVHCPIGTGRGEQLPVWAKGHSNALSRWPAEGTQHLPTLHCPELGGPICSTRGEELTIRAKGHRRHPGGMPYLQQQFTWELNVRGPGWKAMLCPGAPGGRLGLCQAHTAQQNCNQHSFYKNHTPFPPLHASGRRWGPTVDWLHTEMCALQCLIECIHASFFDCGS